MSLCFRIAFSLIVKFFSGSFLKSVCVLIDTKVATRLRLVQMYEMEINVYYDIVTKTVRFIRFSVCLCDGRHEGLCTARTVKILPYSGVWRITQTQIFPGIPNFKKEQFQNNTETPKCRRVQTSF